MSSSFMCPNCGIKVSSLEENGCPGCGHKQSDSSNDTESNVSELKSALADNPLTRNLLGNKMSEISYAIDFFREHVDDRVDEYLKNPKEYLYESERKCLSVIKDAPNEESKNVLYSYLSTVYVQMGRFDAALESGMNGVKCEEAFFRNQSFDSIFYGFAELNLNEDFKTWLDTARESNHPSLTYHEIQYFVNTGDLKAALAKCDEYAAGNPGGGSETRARIYQELGYLDEAEAIYRKAASRRSTTPFYANSANSFAFSILMPQNRFVEAEAVLVQALATKDVRERVNAYSNLAMVAYNLREYIAAKRYAEIGVASHDRAIASESRLTLCRIEYQKLSEAVRTSVQDWDELLALVLKNLQLADFDDAAEFFKYLIASTERSSQKENISEIIENQYQLFKRNIEWEHSHAVRREIERTRVEKLSELLLLTQENDEIETLFLSALDYLRDQDNHNLLTYLQRPTVSVAFKKRCLAITDLDFLSEWAQLESEPTILLELAKCKRKEILKSVAENPTSPDEALKMILEEEDLDLNFAICTREHLATEIIKFLITDSYDAVRKEIAQRPDLSAKDYERLATDASLLVRDAIKENSAVSPEIKALAALGSL